MRKRSLVRYVFSLFYFPSKLRQKGGFPNTTVRVCLGPFYPGGDKSVGGDSDRCSQSWARPGGRCATRFEPSQRKLSLSPRDDPNYKDIMRSRAQLADTL